MEDRMVPAEVYLRRRADQVLREVPASAAGPAGRPRLSELLRPVEDVAMALVAAGWLACGSAQRVEDDLRRALIGKGVGDPASLAAPSRWELGPARPAGEPFPFPPRTAWRCPADVRLRFGDLRLRYLVIASEDNDGGSMRLMGDLDLHEPLPPPPDPVSEPVHWDSVLDRVSDLVIVDEAGRPYEVVDRGGSSTERTALFAAIIRPALAAGVRRLLVGPTDNGEPARITLEPPATVGIGAVRPVAAASPAARWLRARADDIVYEQVRGISSPPEPDLAECSAALIAVGALEADDPAVTDAHALLGVVGGTRPTGDLPEHWRGAFPDWGPDSGWDTSVVLAVRAPPLGNTHVWLEAVTVRRGRAEIRVEVSPWDCTPRMTRWPDELVIAAVDDRGGRYLARPFGYGASPDIARLGYAFVPHLNPAIQRLRLELSTSTHVCDVSFDVPAR